MGQLCCGALDKRSSDLLTNGFKQVSWLKAWTVCRCGELVQSDGLVMLPVSILTVWISVRITLT